MASRRLQPLNLVDFSGGLNLRTDAFQLAVNESADMLNVEVDPRGGFQVRAGWDSYGTSIADPWNPRNGVLHRLAGGTEYVVLANGGELLVSSTGTFATMTDGTDPVAVAAPNHLADFAPWGDDLYIACGTGEQAAKWSGSTATLLTAAGAANWNNNNTVPIEGVMPKANFACTHMGYLFVAGTEEDGQTHPYRIRWSHPNNPEDWAELDRLDIFEDGPITAIVSFGDHLLIFKERAVHALYGTDGDNWQRYVITKAVGAIHRTAVVRAEQAVFFFSDPEGVYSWNGSEVREQSEQLRPAIRDDFNRSALNNLWLGWFNQRLWLGAPYDDDASPSDARSVFVLDPTLGGGSWTRFQAADGDGLGPFVGPHACLRQTADVVTLEGRPGVALDDIGGADVPIAGRYRTRWLDGGFPTTRKSWRRPDFVVKQSDQDYSLDVKVYRDFEESVHRRRFTIAVGADGSTAVYGDGSEYGDGTLYGRPAEGSTIERGSSLGPARAVQLSIEGEAGKPWGVDAVVTKFIMRRFR